MMLTIAGAYPSPMEETGTSHTLNPFTLEERISGKIGKTAFDRAVGKTTDIAKLIVVHPADCIEEMHLKIKAALWSVDCDTPVDKLDDWSSSVDSGEEIDALLSLRRDLRQLQEENAVAVAHMLKLYGINPKGKHQPRT
jgi:hypothetical protein